MNYRHAVGFAPVFDGDSVALILGSFPSVKSRAVRFYYGNPQNRFWRLVCGFFGEEIPVDAAGKTAFLKRRKIALWDVVTECDVLGSSDASIRGALVADIPSLLKKTAVTRIYCNGRKSYELLTKYFPVLADTAVLLPSTSPANGRFTAEPWTNALAGIQRAAEGL